jgi:SAM-dependent methyltransferase
MPDDRILEIGCGLGHAIGPISELLETGHLTAIDRSAKMVRFANQANRSQIAERKVEVLNLSVPGSGLRDQVYDKIFLFNINAFWMDPVNELKEIGELLKKEGRFYIFHQPPPGCDRGEYAEAFERNLTKNSFEVLDVLYSESEKLNAVCVASRPVSHR